MRHISYLTTITVITAANDITKTIPKTATNNIVQATAVPVTVPICVPVIKSTASGV